MIRRSLLTAALILVGSVALAPKTMAQTVDVPFTGTVGGACNFDQVTPGSLGMNQPSNPTALAGGFTGGAFGQVSVTCNAPSQLTVSQPVQTGGPTFTPMFADAFVNSSSGSTFANGGSPMMLPVGSPTMLNVDMYVDKGSPLTPGTYDYKVTLTVTP
ncbi:hypothetical protein QUB80_11990 [Chlorogloeopsis sp. ULAP01]|uniref:hypothetical protein n=1 Tax=Chlorogloeopsis sp. ULAP01 TaxID=3056483 RepID=UPI0025AB0923|nr:hypothetical protein [Chlorogloeopsis sp. ULAP01]MDM9381422.1 hypothetical protein [Chlorogloeopsis sp. ULAP01]